ncbi:retrovirus-related pol polyprotein from transposon TNT 1-94 [Tanacetum coccineum]
MTSEDLIYDEPGQSYVLNTPSEVNDLIPFLWKKRRSMSVSKKDVSSVEMMQLMSILDEMMEEGVQSRLNNKPDMVMYDSGPLNCEILGNWSGNYEKRARQFCDYDLEVAFRSILALFVDVKGTDILKGSRGTNLYTISIDEMMDVSPICLLSKASRSKSWLWHRRLNHLNFGTINDLARKDLVRGLPILKFEKDHLCSACQLGKSKKFSHRPKSGKSIWKFFITIHMDCITWVKFLRSKDEKHPEFVTNFLSKYRLVLNKSQIIRTITETEVVNQVILKYYEGVGIFHSNVCSENPQQNDVVERVIVNGGKQQYNDVILESYMFLWAEAVATCLVTPEPSIISRKFALETLKNREWYLSGPCRYAYGGSIENGRGSHGGFQYQAKLPKSSLTIQSVFRYLKGTINMGLWYPKDNAMSLTAYADADHAGCQDSRRSTSGSAQFLGDRLVCCIKEQRSTAIINYELNTSPCLDVHSRSKHIDICHHFIQGSSGNRVVKLLLRGNELSACSHSHKHYKRTVRISSSTPRIEEFDPETLRRLQEGGLSKQNVLMFLQLLWEEFTQGIQTIFLHHKAMLQSQSGRHPKKESNPLLIPYGMYFQGDNLTTWASLIYISIDVMISAVIIWRGIYIRKSIGCPKRVILIDAEELDYSTVLLCFTQILRIRNDIAITVLSGLCTSVSDLSIPGEIRL